MADEADVETALVTLAAAALYPDGADQPSVPGPDCRIYRGWPSAAALDSDLRAGSINVTIFPLSDATRITSRHMQEWIGIPSAPTLSAEVQGSSVLLSGTADPGQLAGILADRCSYVYRTQPGDTPALVAATLASQARTDWTVAQTGCRLTLHGPTRLLARVVVDGRVSKEVRRQEQGFRVTCWCPTPTTRDVTATAIDVAFAKIAFINMLDGSCARITYEGTSVYDQSQDALLYRRDLIYRIEYPTIVDDAAPSMLFGDFLLNRAEIIA